jgi:hypothetical protein
MPEVWNNRDITISAPDPDTGEDQSFDFMLDWDDQNLKGMQVENTTPQVPMSMTEAAYTSGGGSYSVRDLRGLFTIPYSDFSHGAGQLSLDPNGADAQQYRAGRFIDLSEQGCFKIGYPRVDKFPEGGSDIKDFCLSQAAGGYVFFSGHVVSSGKDDVVPEDNIQLLRIFAGTPAIPATDSTAEVPAVPPDEVPTPITLGDGSDTAPVTAMAYDGVNIYVATWASGGSADSGFVYYGKPDSSDPLAVWHSGQPGTNNIVDMIWNSNFLYGIQCEIDDGEGNLITRGIQMSPSGAVVPLTAASMTAQPNIQSMGLANLNTWVYWLVSDGLGYSAVYRFRSATTSQQFYELVRQLPDGYVGTSICGYGDGVFIGGYFNEQYNGQAYLSTMYFITDSGSQTSIAKLTDIDTFDPKVSSRIRALAAGNRHVYILTDENIFRWNVNTGGWSHLCMAQSNVATLGGGGAWTPDQALSAVERHTGIADHQWSVPTFSPKAGKVNYPTADKTKSDQSPPLLKTPHESWAEWSIPTGVTGNGTFEFTIPKGSWVKVNTHKHPYQYRANSPVNGPLSITFANDQVQCSFLITDVGTNTYKAWSGHYHGTGKKKKAWQREKTTLKIQAEEWDGTNGVAVNKTVKSGLPIDADITVRLIIDENVGHVWFGGQEVLVLNTLRPYTGGSCLVRVGSSTYNTDNHLGDNCHAVISEFMYGDGAYYGENPRDVLTKAGRFAFAGGMIFWPLSGKGYSYVDRAAQYVQDDGYDLDKTKPGEDWPYVELSECSFHMPGIMKGFYGLNVSHSRLKAGQNMVCTYWIDGKMYGPTYAPMDTESDQDSDRTSTFFAMNQSGDRVRARIYLVDTDPDRDWDDRLRVYGANVKFVPPSIQNIKCVLMAYDNVEDRLGSNLSYAAQDAIEFILRCSTANSIINVALPWVTFDAYINGATELVAPPGDRDVSQHQGRVLIDFQRIS